MAEAPDRNVVRDLLAEKAKQQDAASEASPAWTSKETPTLSGCFDKSLTAIVYLVSGGNNDPTSDELFAITQDETLIALQQHPSLSSHAHAIQRFLREVVETYPPKLQHQDTGKAIPTLAAFMAKSGAERLKIVGESPKVQEIVQLTINFQQVLKDIILQALRDVNLGQLLEDEFVQPQTYDMANLFQSIHLAIDKTLPQIVERSIPFNNEFNALLTCSEGDRSDGGEEEGRPREEGGDGANYN